MLKFYHILPNLSLTVITDLLIVSPRKMRTCYAKGTNFRLHYVCVGVDGR